MLPWSSGQDVALSRRNQGFDSPWEYQKDAFASFFISQVFAIANINNVDVGIERSRRHIKCLPLWLKTCHRQLFLTRRTPWEYQKNIKADWLSFFCYSQGSVFHTQDIFNIRIERTRSVLKCKFWV